MNLPTIKKTPHLVIAQNAPALIIEVLSIHFLFKVVPNYNIKPSISYR